MQNVRFLLTNVYLQNRTRLPLMQFCSNLVPNHGIYAPRSLPTVCIGNLKWNSNKVDYKIKIVYLGLPITEAQRAYAGMSLAGWFTISISLIQFRNRGSFSISTRKENMIINIHTMYLHINILGALTKYRLLKKSSWTSY